VKPGGSGPVLVNPKPVTNALVIAVSLTY